MTEDVDARTPEVIPEEAIHEEVKPPEVSARDAANWAKHISQLSISDAPAEAINLNVTERRVMSPIQGFGKMWQKTYRVSLNGAQESPKFVRARVAVARRHQVVPQDGATALSACTVTTP
jgi:hypothetical protein